MGEGRYEWIGLDGVHRSATHWDDLPERMDRIVAFLPDALPPPHTEEQHAAMEEFMPRFKEALQRCRR